MAFLVGVRLELPIGSRARRRGRAAGAAERATLFASRDTHAAYAANYVRF